MPRDFNLRVISALTGFLNRVIVYVSLWVFQHLCGASISYKFQTAAFQHWSNMPWPTQDFILNTEWLYVAFFSSLILWALSVFNKNFQSETRIILKNLSDLTLILSVIAIILGAVLPWLPMNPGIVQH
jgi:hypothetical protein